MKKTSKLARFFKCFWLEAMEPNMEWDKLLNTLMDFGEVTAIDDYTITFDDKYRVWIENHPYYSGSLYKNTEGWVNNKHCTKTTKIRLEDFVFAITNEDVLLKEKRLEYIMANDKD